ncbi:uncharacterized protein LOC112190061 isoform X2 [Rosa chinensis]|uniref:uncharacterized protein LOC112190061 isoform X2 n=1 Tax=Rosa chinensis TaxID=74649 RepID=UPI001AD944E3|nr:uncharacterized protein LOC112190061 isoform X2 [Rosa chinensis]
MGYLSDSEMSVRGGNTGFSSEKMVKCCSPSKAEGPEAALKGEEKPKAAGYYWFKLKLGEPLTSEEEAKAADYSLEDLLDEGLKFCTICGQEDHWVYCCEKYYEEYKCPYGTNFIPPGINQHHKMPSDVWTDSDQEYLDLLCIDDYVPEGFEYLHTVSEIKNIHRILIQQHNEIKDYVSSGIDRARLCGKKDQW